MACGASNEVTLIIIRETANNSLPVHPTTSSNKSKIVRRLFLHKMTLKLVVLLLAEDG